MIHGNSSVRDGVNEWLLRRTNQLCRLTSYSWDSFLAASLCWSKHVSVCVFVCAFCVPLSSGVQVVVVTCFRKNVKGFWAVEMWHFSGGCLICPHNSQEVLSFSQSTNLNAYKLVSVRKLGKATIQTQQILCCMYAQNKNSQNQKLNWFCTVCVARTRIAKNKSLE